MSEEYCDDCRGANVVWFAPNEIWNKVVRPHGEVAADIMLCPQDEALRAEAAGIHTTRWAVTPELPDATSIQPLFDVVVVTNPEGTWLMLNGKRTDACVRLEDVAVGMIDKTFAAALQEVREALLERAKKGVS